MSLSKNLLGPVVCLLMLTSCAHQADQEVSRSTASAKDLIVEEVVAETTGPEQVDYNDYKGKADKALGCKVELISKPAAKGKNARGAELVMEKSLLLHVYLGKNDGTQTDHARYFIVHVKENGEFGTFDYRGNETTKKDLSAKKEIYKNNISEDYAIEFKFDDHTNLRTIKNVRIIEKAGVKDGPLFPSFSFKEKIRVECKF